MRTVFTNAYDIAHLWAHELQSEARYSGGNFYFEGDTIYSYGSHFPCGKIVRNANGLKAYVLNTDSYSSTTAKHKAWVREAIPVGKLIFGSSNCDCPYTVTISNKTYHAGYHDAINFVLHSIETVVQLLNKHKSARTRDYRQEIADTIRTMVKWINFWGLDNPAKWYGFESKKREYCLTKRDSAIGCILKNSNIVPLSNLKDWHNDCERIAKLQTVLQFMLEANLLDGIGGASTSYTNEKIDALYERVFGEGVADLNARIKAARKAFQRKTTAIRKVAVKKCREALDKWHNNESYSWCPAAEFVQAFGWHTALRLHNNVIETSKGIRISLEEGKRLWKLIKSFEAYGDYKRDLALDVNGTKWAFNSYSNHILTAGCHQIPYSECERIAKLMNW